MFKNWLGKSIMLVKNKIMKDLTLVSWKKLGVAQRLEIAEDVALQILRSSYSEIEKKVLLAKLTTIGFNLKALSKEGFGYNTSSEAHYDRDNAGKLTKNNKNAKWVFKKVA